MTTVTIGEALGRWTEIQPDHPAITCGDTTRTFQEFERRTNQLARRLLASGVQSGDWVAIALPNSTDMVEAIFAANKAGARLIPLSAKLPQPEMRAILSVARPAAVISREETCPAGYPCIAPDEAALAGFSDAPLEPVRVERWQALPSGGSTGRPKLIVTTRPGEIDIDDPRMEMRRGEVVLVPGPLYHGAPFTYAVHSLCWGNHVVVMPRFDAQETLRMIDAYHANLVVMVPTMMHRIWRIEPAVRERYALNSLRALIHMGAPCPEWLKLHFMEWLGHGRIHEFYSVTEQLCMTWITGEEWFARRGSVGRAIRGKIRIIGENGNELPPGEVGEVYMMPDDGPGTSYKYVGSESKRRPDGWETTGDLGSVDREGYLFLTDRRSDMIVTGGANVYPAEVEAVLDEYPGVVTSAVIGLPDDEYGSRIHAIVETNTELDVARLTEWMRSRLVAYKIPRSFEFVSGPLRSDAGKLRRSALREERLIRTR